MSLILQLQTHRLTSFLTQCPSAKAAGSPVSKVFKFFFLFQASVAQPLQESWRTLVCHDLVSLLGKKETNVSVSASTGLERGCLKGLINFDWIRMQALCTPCSQNFRTSALQAWFKPWQNWTLCGLWSNGICWSLK